jgi:hypothetical protein
MSGSPSNGGDPLIPMGTDPAARPEVAAPPTPAHASARCSPGADSCRRCHAHTAEANAAPPMRPAPPIPLSHLVERRRTFVPAPHLRDEQDGPRHRRDCGRGPARGAVAAPTSVAVVLGLHRVRSTAPIDHRPAMSHQRTHRFTCRLSLDDWALPFIHFGPGLPVRSLLIAGSDSVVAPVRVTGELRFGSPSAGTDPQQAATPLRRRLLSPQRHG